MKILVIWLVFFVLHCLAEDVEYVEDCDDVEDTSHDDTDIDMEDVDDEVEPSPDDPPMVIPSNFGEFATLFNKTYTSKEEKAMAGKVFKEIVQEVKDHNKQYKYGNVSYKIDLHEFSDVAVERLVRLRNGRQSAPEESADDLDDINEEMNRTKRAAIPQQFSWVERGKVTKIKNQRLCGGCYAFSTAAAIESMLLLHRNKRVNLSPQQTIDCSSRQGNYGCQGGYETRAFRYIKSAGGLNPWRRYPYRGNSGRCRVKKFRKYGRLGGFRRFKNVSPVALKTMLLRRGPICVAMDASNRSFINYRSGIYETKRCNKRGDLLNHALLLVGFGSEKGIDYWLIKNSWGRSWGLNGYVKIAIEGNTCGIMTDVSYPFLKK